VSSLGGTHGIGRAWRPGGIRSSIYSPEVLVAKLGSVDAERLLRSATSWQATEPAIYRRTRGSMARHDGVPQCFARLNRRRGASVQAQPIGRQSDQELHGPRRSVWWRCVMSQRRPSHFGLMFTLLALIAQLASGAAVLRTQVAATLANVTVICHADETSDPAPTVPHNPAECPICPLCVSLSSPAVALMAHPALPTPRAVVVASVVVLPPPTAPPSTVVLAAQPRGPPISLT
jgi:hypothetical protein